MFFLYDVELNRTIQLTFSPNREGLFIDNELTVDIFENTVAYVEHIPGNSSEYDSHHAQDPNKRCRIYLLNLTTDTDKDGLPNYLDDDDDNDGFTDIQEVMNGTDRWDKDSWPGKPDHHNNNNNDTFAFDRFTLALVLVAVAAPTIAFVVYKLRRDGVVK